MLYNNIKLPDIDTVWTDKKACPYAVIRDMGAYEYHLYIMTHNTTQVGTTTKTKAESVHTKYILLPSTGRYILDSTAAGVIDIGTTDEPIIWSNHNIVDTSNNNALYLAGTKPKREFYEVSFRLGITAGLSLTGWDVKEGD